MDLRKIRTILLISVVTLVLSCSVSTKGADSRFLGKQYINSDYALCVTAFCAEKVDITGTSVEIENMICKLPIDIHESRAEFVYFFFAVVPLNEEIVGGPVAFVFNQDGEEISGLLFYQESAALHYGSKRKFNYSFKIPTEIFTKESQYYIQVYFKNSLYLSWPL